MPNHFENEVSGSAGIFKSGSTIFSMKVPRDPVKEHIWVDQQDHLRNTLNEGVEDVCGD